MLLLLNEIVNEIPQGGGVFDAHLTQLKTTDERERLKPQGRFEFYFFSFPPKKYFCHYVTLSKIHNSSGQRTAFQFSAHQITRCAATAYIIAHFGYSCCIPGGQLHANLTLMGTGYTTALVGEKSPCYASGCCFSKLSF